MYHSPYRFVSPIKLDQYITHHSGNIDFKFLVKISKVKATGQHCLSLITLITGVKGQGHWSVLFSKWYPYSSNSSMNQSFRLRAPYNCASVL